MIPTFWSVNKTSSQADTISLSLHSSLSLSPNPAWNLRACHLLNPCPENWILCHWLTNQYHKHSFPFSPKMRIRWDPLHGWDQIEINTADTISFCRFAHFTPFDIHIIYNLLRCGDTLYCLLCWINSSADGCANDAATQWWSQSEVRNGRRFLGCKYNYILYMYIKQLSMYTSSYPVHS